MAYDVLSRGKSLPASSHARSRRGACSGRRGWPQRDCRARRSSTMVRSSIAERLALENALDARAHGGVRASPITRSSDTVSADGRVTGRRRARRPDRGAVSRGRGAGGRQRRRTLGRRGARRSDGRAAAAPDRGQQGSHIIVAPFPGAPRDALYAEARQDGRPFLHHPLERTLPDRHDGHPLRRGSRRRRRRGMGDRLSHRRDKPHHPEPRT